MKEIQIIRGEEFKVQVRDQIDEKDLFVEEYRKAAHLLEEILYASKKQLNSKNNNLGDNSISPFFVNNHTEYNNNIIAFCGERGDGKSSAMMTFLYAAKNPEKADQCGLFEQGSIVKDTKFIDTIHVDPSALDDVHNVLDIVVANMFRHFKCEHENGKRQNVANQREHLVKCFQNVYRALSLKKDSSKILREEFDDEGSIAKLSKLSDSMRLKEYMSQLMGAYFEYMMSPMSSSSIQNCAILISIDDLDLSISSAYSMSEEIRKYLVLPGIVIVMAVRTKQLHLSLEENNISQFKQQFEKADAYQMRQEVQEMSERYVAKLLPLAHRIYLPRIQDFQDIQVLYVNPKDGDNDRGGKSKIADSLVDFSLQKIYQKTGMIFRPFSQGHSIILPNNIRGMVSLIVLLDDMEDPTKKKNEIERDGIKHRNILKFLDSYFREWVNTLPARSEKEVVIRQEMQKLIDFDIGMHLHIGINTILDNLQEIYVAPSITKLSDQFRNDSDWGTDTMCCVMNMIRYMAKVHYRLEVKQYIAAASFLYTIKLNLLITKTKQKKWDYALDQFVKYVIWGYDFLNVIPFVAPPFNAISRGRFILPSAIIFNTIAKSLRLPSDIMLEVSNITYVSHKIPKPVGQRNRYILAWVLFGMLCNNFDVKSNPSRPQMIPWTRFIYNNYALNSAEQVSLENFIVRMCMLESLFEQLNLEVLGITHEEFQDVIHSLKENNEVWVSLSRIIVANVDIIQEILGYCFYNNDYKKATDDEFDRSKKLIEKFLKNLISYFENSEYNDTIIKNTERANNIFFLRYGNGEDEKIDLANLYACLIQEGIDSSANVQNDNMQLYQKQFQNFLDALEMRNVSLSSYDEFAHYVTQKTKLSKVQEHLNNMAKDIGKYMLLSGDREYLSNEWKTRLCDLYGKVIDGQQKNHDAIVTDSLRQEYKDAASHFNPKKLNDAINGLLNTQKT